MFYLFFCFFKQLPFTVEDTLWCRNLILIEPAINHLNSLKQVNATGG